MIHKILSSRKLFVSLIFITSCFHKVVSFEDDVKLCNKTILSTEKELKKVFFRRYVSFCQAGIDYEDIRKVLDNQPLYGQKFEVEHSLLADFCYKHALMFDERDSYLFYVDILKGAFGEALVWDNKASMFLEQCIGKNMGWAFLSKWYLVYNGLVKHPNHHAELLLKAVNLGVEQAYAELEKLKNEKPQTDEDVDYEKMYKECAPTLLKKIGPLGSNLELATQQNIEALERVATLEYPKTLFNLLDYYWHRGHNHEKVHHYASVVSKKGDALGTLALALSGKVDTPDARKETVKNCIKALQFLCFPNKLGHLKEMYEFRIQANTLSLLMLSNRYKDSLSLIKRLVFVYPDLGNTLNFFSSFAELEDNNYQKSYEFLQLSIKDNLSDRHNAFIHSTSATLLFKYLTNTHNRESLIFKHTLEAANYGHVPSIYEIALMYEEGYGIDKSNKKAFAWHEKAAKHSVVESLYHLSVAYKTGKYGAKKCDPKLAYKYTLKAANLSHPAALYNLGVCYFMGDLEVKKNIDTAVDYFKKAADLNFLPAVEQLYKIFSISEVPENQQLAQVYLLRLKENEKRGDQAPILASPITNNLDWQEKESELENKEELVIEDQSRLPKALDKKHNQLKNKLSRQPVKKNLNGLKEKNQVTLQNLLEKKQDDVCLNDISHLLSDPIFENDRWYFRDTKSGILVIDKIQKSATSTHDHFLKSKGFDKNFLKELGELIQGALPKTTQK